MLVVRRRELGRSQAMHPRQIAGEYLDLQIDESGMNLGRRGHGRRDDHQDQDKKNCEIREFHSLASRTNTSFALTNAS